MNKKILTPLFLAASFLIVGCSTSEIVGRPSWINDPIVNDDVKDKSLKEIYDAIKELGDTNSNVLNKVMYDIAKKQLGSFEDVKNDAGEVVEVGLKTIYNGGATNEQIDAFIEKHPTYKSDEITYVLNSEYKAEEKAITEEADKRANSVSKIKATYERIYEDIFEKLFEEIKGGSYSTKLDKLFEEDYFVQHLYKEMYYEDYDPDPTKDPKFLAKDRVFLPKAEGQDWSAYVNTTGDGGVDTDRNGFLHVDTSTTKKGNFTKYYQEYIARKLLPDIYRTLLIENYVREQRSTNLGRSYARKVNMITVPYYPDEPQVNNNIRNMLNAFASDSIAVDNPLVTKNDFEDIKDAMVGFATNGSTAVSMLSNFDKLSVDGQEYKWPIRTKDDGRKDISTTDHPTTSVYRGTKLYDLVIKYTKVVNIKHVGGTAGDYGTAFKSYPKSHLTSDEQSAYDDLTNKGAYTLEKGLELKERELRLTDMTQDGWFLKSGGLTDLNETFREQLFNITTSSIVDNESYMGNDTKQPEPNDTVRYYGDATRDADGRYTNRMAFVFDKHKEEAKSVVLDDGKSNFYIVAVEEAASASKLSPTEKTNSYLELKATKNFDQKTNVETNEIYSKVTEQVANSDTYKKNAEQYYLMISNILFYDQSVYDYFKSQFPDLFK